MTAPDHTLAARRAEFCPFCGSLDNFSERVDLTIDCRVCNDCGARGPLVEADGAYEKRNGDAIMDNKTRKAWNARSGQLITLSDHETAVQAAVANAVDECADMFHPEQLTVWASEILGDLSQEGVLDINDYGAKVVAYDIVARHLQAIAAAIRARKGDAL